MDPGVIKLMTADNRVRSNMAMQITGAGGIAGDSPETTWSQVELMMRFAVSIGGGTMRSFAMSASGRSAFPANWVTTKTSRGRTFLAETEC